MTDARPAPAHGRSMWARDLDGALAVRSQVILWGNIRDVHPVPEPAGEAQLRSLLLGVWEVLEANGFDLALVHDRVAGLHVLAGTPERQNIAGELLGLDLSEDSQAVSLERLGEYVETTVRSRDHRVAIILDYASHITNDPQQLGADEQSFFLRCLKLSHTAVPLMRPGAGRGALYNPVIWLLDRLEDVPDWLLLGNDAIRTVAVPRPDYGQRLETASRAAVLLHDHASLGSPRREELLASFAGLTDGMTSSSIVEISRLAFDRGLGLGDVADAVRAYKVGVLDNPWKRDFVRDRIVEAERSISERILGQPQAVTKALDLLKRSVMGLSGAQAESSRGRPRGLLFLAGPTGVGKTALAKALTRAVFGDEESYIRFDMSEFASEHAEARLIGAPPGYVGFGAGGELTNAVRAKPFSLVLFDEIDKAADRILDKFLQILEDGRLTDGRGTTVHFSETVIVFTSNLGIYIEDENGHRVAQVTPGTPYEEVEERVKNSISDHFNLQLNRPELLNRFGGNIVVFDFVSAEVARAIFERALSNIVHRVREEHGVTLEIAPQACEQLAVWCTEDLTHGGRGVENAVETTFVNPLARALFERAPEPEQLLCVEQVRCEAGVHTVVLA